MDLVAELMEWYGRAAGAALVFARVVGIFLSSPMVGGPAVPAPIRALLALALTVLLEPILHDRLPQGVANGWLYALALGRELAVGLTLGWLLSLFFDAARFAGDLIGRNAGYAASEYFDPASETTTGPLGDLYYYSIALLFLAADGHHVLLASLARSWDVVDIGAFQVGPALLQATLNSVELCMRMALALAFPVFATLMAVIAAEGVITRAVPQINILHITFATKISVTTVVLFLGMPAAVGFMGGMLVLARETLMQALPLMAIATP